MPTAPVPLLARFAPLILVACGGGTEPAVDCERLPLAPAASRVDLAPPQFTTPTVITNPLFPISRLRSAVLLGTSDGLPFRAETTLLPTQKVLSVNGQTVRALESQYVAFLDGRIHEVALDWYAQANDGAVWYLGEDVFNFEDGVVADREGTWQVGRDGPAAMIMPANPKVGDVYRAENACPLVFEEVTVTRVGATVNGPSGPVQGAVLVSELHMDGGREVKTFAPGYGEFLTSDGSDSEALAVASDTDRRAGGEPAELGAVLSAALGIEGAAVAGQWGAAASSVTALRQGWGRLAAVAPPLLAAEMTRVLTRLDAAITARQLHRARIASFDAARIALDVRLLYRNVIDVDRARFALWAAQATADADARLTAFVRGDVVSLEQVWLRVAAGVDAAQRSAVEALLRELRTAADGARHTTAATLATQLRTLVAPQL